MSNPVYDAFGDEVTAADFDDYIPPKYKRELAAHPDCRDPDHPMCDKCSDESSDDPEEDTDTDDLDCLDA